MQGTSSGSSPHPRTDRLELVPAPPEFIEAALAGDFAAADAILRVRVTPNRLAHGPRRDGEAEAT